MPTSHPSDPRFPATRGGRRETARGFDLRALEAGGVAGAGRPHRRCPRSPAAFIPDGPGRVAPVSDGCRSGDSSSGRPPTTSFPPSRAILTLHRCPPSPPPPPPPSLSAPPPRKRRSTPRSRLTGRLGGPGPRPPLRPRRPRMRRPPARTLRGRGRATARFPSRPPGLPRTHAPLARLGAAGSLRRKVNPALREARPGEFGGRSSASGPLMRHSSWMDGPGRSASSQGVCGTWQRWACYGGSHRRGLLPGPSSPAPV